MSGFIVVPCKADKLKRFVLVADMHRHLSSVKCDTCIIMDDCIVAVKRGEVTYQRGNAIITLADMERLEGQLES